jgi:hypothetical protein
VAVGRIVFSHNCEPPFVGGLFQAAQAAKGKKGRKKTGNLILISCCTPAVSVYFPNILFYCLLIME